MKSITIHNLEQELGNLIRKKAAVSGTSLNKTIKELLRISLGIDKTGTKRNSLDRFFGVWSKKEAEEFDGITKEEFEVVDRED